MFVTIPNKIIVIVIVIVIEKRLLKNWFWRIMGGGGGEQAGLFYMSDYYPYDVLYRICSIYYL